MAKLTNAQRNREINAQHRILNALEASFKTKVARELAAGYRHLVDAYAETGELPVSYGHQDRLSNLYKAMAIASVSAFAGRIAQQGKDSGVVLELKNFNSDMANAALKYVMSESVRRRITNVSETTRSDIVDAIAQGYDDGLGQQAIAKLVMDKVPSMSSHRAALIARTETHGAANFGAVEAAKATGLRMNKEWIAAIDDRTRFDHLTTNGQIVGPDANFVLTRENGTKYELNFPGDPDGPADGVINCRCAIGWTTEPATAGITPVTAVPPSPKPKVSGAWAGASKAELDHVRHAFGDADETTLAVITKIPSKYRLGSVTRGSGSHYDASKSTVKMDTGHSGTAYERVMRHEYGHFVANVIAKTQIDAGKLATTSKFEDVSVLAIREIGEDGKLVIKSLSGPYANIWNAIDPIANGAPQGATAVRSKLRTYLRAVEREGGDLEKAIDELYALRGLNRSEAAEMFPHMHNTTNGLKDDAIEFLAAFDVGDHRTLVYYAGQYGHSSALSGLSDSIGASTSNRVAYQFGHGNDYYEDFIKSTKNNSITTADGEVVSYTYRYYTDGQGSVVLGVGNTAQMWANWFEAYTSGNKTQYAVFKKLFPNTSAKFETLITEFVNG